jgi:hypothetical protein
LIYSFTLFLGSPHVHVVPGGDEGDGSVKLLVVVGEGVGDDVLLVVVGEGGSGDELLVVGAKVLAANSSSTLSLTQASLLFLDHTSECITKYELEVLIERLKGFRRFIPLIDGKESCNDSFLEGLI